MKPEAVQDDTGGTANFAVGLDWICRRVKRTVYALLRAEQFGVAANTTCYSRISVGTSPVLSNVPCRLPYTVQANVAMILRSRQDGLLPNPFQIPHSSASYHSKLYRVRYRKSRQLFDLSPLQQKEPVHLAINVRSRVVLVTSVMLIMPQRA